MMATEADRVWLRRAVDLAGRCPPSDSAFAVGAIIVDANGTEIARGYSREADPKDHAEESALAKAGNDPRLSTATIYSSLEPCGERRSRPQTCAHLIITSGIGRVLYARGEPTDFVDTPRGHQLLVDAGVQVIRLSP